MPVRVDGERDPWAGHRAHACHVMGQHSANSCAVNSDRCHSSRVLPYREVRHVFYKRHPVCHPATCEDVSTRDFVASIDYTQWKLRKQNESFVWFALIWFPIIYPIIDTILAAVV